MIDLTDDAVGAASLRVHETSVTSADGTRIAVTIHEPTEAGAATVVFSHGWTLAAAVWTAVVKQLAGQVRVVAYDQRGHARSAMPGPAGYSEQALADDLAAVLAGTLATDERAVVVGHSMGGMSIMALAHRHPQVLRSQVAGALLTSTGAHELIARSMVAPLYDRTDRVSMAIKRRVISDARGLYLMPRAVARQVLALMTMGQPVTPEQRDYNERIIRATPPEVYTRFAKMLDALDLRDAVRTLDVPTTVLVGTNDRLTPPWHARQLMGLLPQPVELIEVPGPGHQTMIECPSRVASAALGVVRATLGVAQEQEA